jgi:hypothetical protein
VANPPGRVLAPRSIVIFVERSDRAFDQLPPLLAFERSSDGARHVRAPLANSNPPVDFANEDVIKGNVYAHGHTITHVLAGYSSGCSWKLTHRDDRSPRSRDDSAALRRGRRQALSALSSCESTPRRPGPKGEVVATAIGFRVVRLVRGMLPAEYPEGRMHI